MSMRRVCGSGTLLVVVINLTAARRGLAANPALPFDLLRSLLDTDDRPTLVALAGGRT
jgi:hypothetical protein